jgi:hypothetical protein
MAALDARLRQAEQFSRTLRMRGRRPDVAEGDGRPATA